MKQGLEYFFPGGCYETVVERGELGNGKRKLGCVGVL